MGFGWGGAGWGSSGWGSPAGGLSGSLQVVSALAVAENAVQITFSEAIYWSGLLDPTDASQPQLWSFSPILSGPIGLDGTKPRPVSAASVAQVDATAVIVTLDRPMTPAPAQYFAIASPLIQVADQSSSLNPAFAQALFTAVFKQLVPPSTQPTSLASRDIAAPVGSASVQDARVPYPQNLLQLGVPVVDDTGDYATDSGLVGLKKRVLRRILFTPGATLFMGQSFGAGAMTYAKKLGTARNRAALAAACEAQVSQDPEVAAVSVQVLSTTTPGLFNLALLVQSRTTGQSFKLIAPMQTE